MKAEWRGRYHFAEVAEALGLPTDCVMSLASAALVTFTETADTEDETPMMMAVLAPNPVTGVLAVLRRWQIGTVADLKASIDDVLRRMIEDDEDA